MKGGLYEFANTLSGFICDGDSSKQIPPLVVVSLSISGKIEENLVATVTICYKKKSSYVKVCLRRMFLRAPRDGDNGIAPTALLVDFCVPRLDHGKYLWRTTYMLVVELVFGSKSRMF